MNIFSKRSLNFLAFLTCYILIAVAYFYMEKTLYLSPCPLCYAQRIVFAILGFWFLIVTFFPGKGIGRVINGLVLFLISIGGAALSTRHLLIQYGHKESSGTGLTSTCGQDFYGLFENTPLLDAVKTMLTGSGDCAEIQWKMFEISIPGWTLIAFVCFAIFAIINNIFRKV